MEGEDKYYHKKGDNFCFKNDCGNVFKYKSNDNSDKTCYKSCLDIGDGSYEIEINFICCQSLPTTDFVVNNYYYITSSGTKKYMLKENAFSECSQQLLNYVRDSQCVIMLNK